MDTRKLGGWLRHIKDRLVDTGTRRFVHWSGSVLLAIMLNTILYMQKIVSPDVFTDALIAIITIAPYLYQYFIYVSILIIEVPKDRGVRKPIFIKDCINTPLHATHRPRNHRPGSWLLKA